MACHRVDKFNALTHAVRAELFPFLLDIRWLQIYTKYGHKARNSCCHEEVMASPLRLSDYSI